MNFTLIAKADVADDADPNVTPPAAARVATIAELIGSKQNVLVGGLALAVRVLTAGNALCADGVADLIPWIYDEATTAWIKGPSSLAALVVNASSIVPLPAAAMTTKVFVQAKTIGGTNKDHVQILVAPTASGEAIAGPGVAPPLPSGAATAANQTSQLAAVAAKAAASPASVEQVGGVYSASPTTRTEGALNPEQQDISGNTLVSLGTDIAGEDRTNNRMRTYKPNTGTRIAANGTTTLKSGAGQLCSITVNTKGATGNTITIYDNTAGSGTVLAVIDTTVQPGTFFYDVAFATGLTVVVANGTAADFTVSFF